MTDLAEAEFSAFVRRLPPVVVAIDVETTGLSHADRIVSFAAVQLQASDVARDAITTDFLHFACAPGRPCHPMARRVHGLTDAFLASHRPFEARAQEVARMLSGANLIIAHNAAFDMRFVMGEVRAAGLAIRWPPAHCTQQEHGGTLDAACGLLGLRRQGARHGAAEDAWLALMLFLAGRGAPAHLLMDFATVSRQAAAAGLDLGLPAPG